MKLAHKMVDVAPAAKFYRGGETTKTIRLFRLGRTHKVSAKNES